MDTEAQHVRSDPHLTKGPSSLRRIKALIIKEFYQIIYDPSCFLITIVLPSILLFLYGFGVSLDLNTIKIGLVVEDRAPDAQSLAQSFTNSPYFDVHLAYDRRELTDMLLAGKIRGFIVIPSYFSQFRELQPRFPSQDFSRLNGTFTEKLTPIATPTKPILSPKGMKELQHAIAQPSSPATTTGGNMSMYLPALQTHLPTQIFSNIGIPSEEIAPIQVITDGSEPNTANFVKNYASIVWQKWLQMQEVSANLTGLPLIQVQPRFWFNEELDSRNFLIPGSLAIIMTLIGTLLTALVIAREWERGTMEALMATPVTITEILIGKMVPYFCLAMVSMFCCVIGTTLCYSIPFRGSFLVLGIITGAFLFSALGIGLLISTVTKNQLAASQAAQVVGFLPAYILSGFLFEISSMPKVIQLITYIIPARYFVRSLLSVFLVGNVWMLVLQDILAMTFFGLIIFVITSRIIVKRLD